MQIKHAGFTKMKLICLLVSAILVTPDAARTMMCR